MKYGVRVGLFLSAELGLKKSNELWNWEMILTLSSRLYLISSCLFDYPHASQPSPAFLHVTIMFKKK